MALSLEALNAVKQRCLAETRKASVQAQLKALFSYLSQHKGSPQLQFVAFADLAGTDVVIADVACKIYGWYIKKPSASATAAFVKASDHATALDEADDTMHVRLPTNDEVFISFFDGNAMTTGFTIGSNTTASGTGATAAADKPNGFVLVGAP
jgi:hypothetical protein